MALAGIDTGTLLEGASSAWDTALATGDWAQGNSAGVDAPCWLGPR